jgi:hypothetical protein
VRAAVELGSILAECQSLQSMKKSVSKKTPQMLAAICTMIEAGLSVQRAAGKLKVHYTTIGIWRRDSPEFELAIQKAEAVFIQRQVSNVQAAADKGSWQASAWLLERKFPSEFSQPQVQLHHGVLKVQFDDFSATLKRLRSSPEAMRTMPDLPVIEVESESPAIGTPLLENHDAASNSSAAVETSA